MTRADLRDADLIVVLDVLRATSTLTAGLAAGYRRVRCAPSIARALEQRAPGRVLAGEQHCVMPAGFDHGNSPEDAGQPRGEELVLATTNGAPTILAAAAHSPRVLIGSLLNLAAVAAEIALRVDVAAATVQLVCSGTDGRIALEDTYAAGRLSALLPGPRTDAARVAEAVARAHPTAYAALNASDDAAVLHEIGAAGDIARCARESVLDVVPTLLGLDGDVGVLGLAADTEMVRATPGLTPGA